MSDSERPDAAAFAELEQVIRALGDEMAGWRRRAHEAEAHLKALETQPSDGGSRGERAPATGAADADGNVAALRAENRELRERLETARQRTRVLLQRLRFLRQQHASRAKQ